MAPSKMNCTPRMCRLCACGGWYGMVCYGRRRQTSNFQRLGGRDPGDSRQCLKIGALLFVTHPVRPPARQAIGGAVGSRRGDRTCDGWRSRSIARTAEHRTPQHHGPSQTSQVTQMRPLPLYPPLLPENRRAWPCWPPQNRPSLPPVSGV